MARPIIQPHTGCRSTAGGGAAAATAPELVRSRSALYWPLSRSARARGRRGSRASCSWPSAGSHRRAHADAGGLGSCHRLAGRRGGSRSLQQFEPDARRRWTGIGPTSLKSLRNSPRHPSRYATGSSTTNAKRASARPRMGRKRVCEQLRNPTLRGRSGSTRARGNAGSRGWPKPRSRRPGSIDGLTSRTGLRPFWPSLAA